MPQESNSDFVEALARGLAIITAFSPTATALSVSDAAARTSLPRPTARRLLMTLEKLGYVRSSNGLYTLTTKVLELGTTYIAALGIWELARPHLEALVALGPDLVVRFGGTQDPRTPARLDELGIPHLAVRPDHVDDIYRTAETLGTVTGHEAEADSLNRLVVPAGVFVKIKA